MDYVPSAVYIARQAIFLGAEEIKKAQDTGDPGDLRDAEAQKSAANAQEKLLAIILAEAATNGRDDVTVSELMQLRHFIAEHR